MRHYWSRAPQTGLRSVRGQGRCLLVLLGLLLTLTCIPGGAGECSAQASEITYIRAQVLTGLSTVVDITSGDLDGDGTVEFLATNKEYVLIFLRRDDGNLRLSEVQAPVIEPITSLAAADIDGNGADELLIGTASAGRIYALRHSAAGLTKLGESDFLWAPVAAIVTGDINGDGRADVVARNNSGTISAYTWDERGLVNLPLEILGDPKVERLVLGDLNGDGTDELAYAVGNELTVLKWDAQREILTPVYRNYFFGNLSGVYIADVDRSPVSSGPDEDNPSIAPEELLLVTDRQIRQLLRWTGEGLRYDSSFAALDLPAAIEWTTVPGLGLLILAKEEGHLVAKAVASTGTRLEPTTLWRSAEVLGEDLIWVQRDGTLILNNKLQDRIEIWQLADSGIRIQLDDTVVKPTDGIVLAQEQVLLRLDDVARWLGLSVETSTDGRAVAIRYKDKEVYFAPPAEITQTDKASIQRGDIDIQVREGQLYVSTSFLAKTLDVLSVWLAPVATLHIQVDTAN